MGAFKLGVPELIIILVIVILLFGVGRVTKIGGEIGGAIKSFRKGIKVTTKKKPKTKPKKNNYSLINALNGLLNTFQHEDVDNHQL